MRTKIPHSPYTTLGIAASRSTRNATGCRSQRGANSERKIATPIASGVARASAMIDETIVPNIAGAAPNFPAGTFHSLEVRKLSPKREKAGHAARPISRARKARSNGMHSAKNVVSAV